MDLTKCEIRKSDFLPLSDLDVILYGGDTSPCTGRRVSDNYEPIASRGGVWFHTQDLWISETPIATHSGVQHVNHWAMTLSKWIGTRGPSQ